MQFRKLIRPVVATLFIAVMGVTAAMADTTHVVNRGETLQSIAQKYGVTTEQIIQANPQAAQFIYVGMELNIPGQASQPQSSAPISQPQVQNTGGSNVMNSSVQQSSINGYEPVLSQWGVDYIANFSDNGKGYYGLFFEGLNCYGWGGFFSAGANYGIVKSGGLTFRLGPDYGCTLAESLVFSIPATVTLSTLDYNKDQKTLWGLAATPKLAYKLEKIHLNVGIDINYTFKKKIKNEIEMAGHKFSNSVNLGGKTYVGFFVALGF